VLAGGSGVENICGYRERPEFNDQVSDMNSGVWEDSGKVLGPFAPGSETSMNSEIAKQLVFRHKNLRMLF
jgi:hypothetical protein